MEPTTFKAVMGQLKAAYSKQEFSEETLALWWSRFEHVEDAAFRQAVTTHIDNSSFAPTIAEIRKRLQAGAVDTNAAEREWRELLYSIARWVPATPWEYAIDAPTRAGLDAIGGAKRLRLLEEDDEPFVRKEFIAAYQSVQLSEANARLGLASGQAPGLLAMPELGDGDRR